MELVVHPDADAFLRDVLAGLEREEARNNLLLGAALALRDAPPEHPPYLAAVREGDALLLAALMTPPRPLVLADAGTGVDAAAERLVAGLLASGHTPRAVHAPDPLARAFAAAWSRATGREVRAAMRQRLYALEELQPTPSVPGRLRRAGEADVELVAGWLEAFDAEALGESDPEEARATARKRVAAGEVYLWDDGGPRTMAASARPTRHSVAVNAVYTPPEWRGRGLATACVAALSARLLGEGRRSCVLFTDLANPTSNSIYTRIGYRPVEDFTLLRLGA